MSILASVVALLLSASAQEVEVPPDPNCPRRNMNWPRGPGTACIGGTRRHYGFSFIYPRAAERIPALIAYFRHQAVAHESWMRAHVNEICGQFEPDHCPTDMIYEQGWSLDADLPVLAAASSFSDYYDLNLRDGHDSDAILIDRRLDRRIALGDLFTDQRRGLAMVQRDFCRNLRSQVRERRRSEIPVAGSISRVADVECPAVGRHPVTLCTEHGRITRMAGEVDAPDVGAFPEGDYVVEVAMTPAMIAALKPAYRSSFGPPGRGPTEDHGTCQR
jgi:hypothetical protein